MVKFLDKKSKISEPRDFNKKWFVFIKNAFALFVLLGFCYYVWSHRGELYNALDVSIYHLVLIVLFLFVSWFLSGVQAAVTYKVTNIRISIVEGVMLTLAGSFGNHLPMRAGTIIRANYLKEIHGLRYAHFSGIMGMRTILTIIATGISGVFGLLLISLSSYEAISLSLVFIFVFLALAPALLLIPAFPTINNHEQGRLRKFISGFSDGYDAMRKNSRICIYIVILLLLQYIVLALRFVVTADSVGVDMSVGLLFLMAPLAALMSYTALTPGGIGLREMVMGYISFELGYTFDSGAFIGTVDRAVLLIMMSIFGGWSFIRIWILCRK